jgi:hypothetical protein
VGWYLNHALTTMRDEVNSRWPGRDKASDGTIGDEAHQSSDSDHNPDADQSVDAWDMDVNLYGASKGIPYDDLEFLKDRFQAHEASQYWIHNRVIASRDDGWKRWNYSGDNPHDKHIHWNTRSSHEDSTKPWGIEDEMTKAEFIDWFADALEDPTVQARLRRETVSYSPAVENTSLLNLYRDVHETTAQIPDLCGAVASVSALAADTLAEVQSIPDRRQVENLLYDAIEELTGRLKAIIRDHEARSPRRVGARRSSDV